MTARAFGTALTGAVLLFAGLTVGSSAFFLGGVLLLCMVLTGLAFLLLNRALLRFSQTADPGETDRGGKCFLVLRCRLILPVFCAPLLLSVRTPDGGSVSYILRLRGFRTSVCRIPISCPHAGMTEAGVTQAVLADCFGFFRFRLRFPLLPLAVLPVPAEIAFPEAGGNRPRPGIAQGQDLPEDLRNWQEGDELHRIHWKISMRRAVLTVRTYEAQQESGFLIVMAGSPASPEIADVLLESCAGLISDVISRGGRLRIVLPDGKETDHPAPVPQDLPVFRRWLAGLSADDALPVRALLRRLTDANRQAECAAILLPFLDAWITERLLVLQRAEGSLFVVLCGKADAEEQALLALLRAEGVRCLLPGGEA